MLTKSLLFGEAVLARACSVCATLLVVLTCLFAAMLSPLLGILIVGGIAWSCRNGGEYRNTHGSARWASIGDLIRAKCIFQTDGLVMGNFRSIYNMTMRTSLLVLFTYPLKRTREAVAIASQGVKNPQPIRLFLPDQYPHLSVYGPSGSGKSSAFVIPAAIEQRESMVILDAKGEIA
ncbi:MAG: type IV secretory system conjugative DNA transfer family protein, partial [Planctomycetales bacterium]|nr:type IV secretory system conjugative DNA transfer family protein [Planctomycetales bacterium]